MNKDDEQVLVIPQKILPRPSSKLNTKGLANFEKKVLTKFIFKRRGDVEEDRSFKQVIPYIVFRYKDKYFLMQRTDKADYRLKNLYSLGIGGHINKQDLLGKSIVDWAKREFDEEIEYQGFYKSQPLGLINDDSVPVNQVHVGYVILFEGDTDQIKVKDEHRLGKLLTIDEINEFYLQMETWSQFVFDFLKNDKAKI